MVKIISIFLVAIFSFFNLSITVIAEDGLPDNYDDIEQAIPDDVSDLLPDGLFGEGSIGLTEGVSEITSFEYVINRIFEIIGLSFGDIRNSLAILCLLLIMCALLNMIKKNIANSEITSVLDMISSAITVLCVIKIVEQPLRQSISVLENIRMFVNTASPLICSMYAMGGNVKAAIVNNYGLLVFLSIFENVCIIGIEIILGVCTSLAVASAFLKDGNLSALSDAIKKCFTFILGFAMLIFTTVISTQNILSAKADSLSSKTAKMLASQMIPLVGSTVGESLKSAGASIEYLRANVGILLIIILVLMIAPTVISLFLYRFTLTFSNAIAGLLSCDKEGKILTEISSILGYALAILIICAIALVYLLTIFAKCSSALN